MTDFDNSLAPPDLVVNQPEPSEPSVEEGSPSTRTLREWSAKWLGLSTYHSAYFGLCIEDGDPWRPDKRIAQAWLLLAKCPEWIISNHPEHVKCSVKIGGVMAKGIADTAPLAIVLAAYRAAQGKETP